MFICIDKLEQMREQSYNFKQSFTDSKVFSKFEQLYYIKHLFIGGSGMIKFDRFKDGKRTILTMSYDDGVKSDERLIQIFNKYGIKGTFHLNSGSLGKEGRISTDEVSDIYKNHEVSSHTVSHPHLEKSPYVNVLQEIINDREKLEELCGYTVRGMSYPFGTYNDDIIPIIKSCGIVYSRTTVATKGFQLPNDFLTWHPTCHHNQCLEIAKQNYIKNLNYIWRIPLFYVWGHSYEFDNEDNWDMIEEFCKLMSGREDIWYATNIEIYDYVMSQRNLQISVNNSIVHNPSAMTVWFSYNDETVEIKGGETIRL